MVQQYGIYYKITKGRENTKMIERIRGNERGGEKIRENENGRENGRERNESMGDKVKVCSE